MFLRNEKETGYIDRCRHERREWNYYFSRQWRTLGQYPVMEVASADGFARNPKLVHEFYNQRRRELVNAKP